MEGRCCGKNVAEHFVKNPTQTASYTKTTNKAVGKILMTASVLEIKYMKTCFNSSMPTPHSQSNIFYLTLYNHVTDTPPLQNKETKAQ